MKAIHIKEFEDPQVIELNGKSGELQNLIGGWIDIVRRKIGDTNEDYLIICDDEGILKSRTVTAIVDGRPALVGDLIIVRLGKGEDFAPLSDSDVDNIFGAIERVIWEKDDGFIMKNLLKISY